MTRIDPTRLMRLAVLINKGSFRKAADDLGLTQPALSQSIAQLESEVGVKLIERTPHGVEPTVHGEALYKHAKAIDWELTQASQRMDELAGGSQGSVTVGASGGAAMIMAAQAICRLQASRPGVNSHIVEEFANGALLSQLHDRNLDLIICARPPDFALRGARALRLFPATRVACVRAGHPLGRHPSLKELLQFPLVCPEDEMGLLSDIKKVFSDEGLEMPQSKIIMSNSLAVGKEIIRHSDAYAIVSDLSVRQECESGEFTISAPPNQQPYWYHLLARPEQAPTGLVLSFINEIFFICDEWNVPINSDSLLFARTNSHHRVLNK